MCPEKNRSAMNWIRCERTWKSAQVPAEGLFTLTSPGWQASVPWPRTSKAYKVGVRTVMKAEDLQARREGRIKGLVADMIQAEPKLEQALEAVLGDKLQYIIVESQKDGKEAWSTSRSGPREEAVLFLWTISTATRERRSSNGSPLS
jgi:hypothetical protein